MIAILEGYKTGSLNYTRGAKTKSGFVYASYVEEDPEELLSRVYPLRLIRLLGLNPPEGIQRLIKRIGRPPYKAYLSVSDRLETYEKALAEARFIIGPPSIADKLQEIVESLDRYIFYCPLINAYDDVPEGDCVAVRVNAVNFKFLKRVKATIKIAFIKRPLLNSSPSGLANLCTALGASIIATKEPLDELMVRPSLLMRIPLEISPEAGGVMVNVL